jgi:hypothetical protein
MKKFVLLPEIIYRQIVADDNVKEAHLEDMSGEKSSLSPSLHRDELPCYGVPNRYRKRAQDLSLYLTQISPDELKWGEDGCVTIHNNNLQNSNIFDYISFLVNPLSKTPPPHIEPFLKFLLDKNCPKILIHNVQANEFMNAMSSAKKKENSQEMTTSTMVKHEEPRVIWHRF